MDLSSWDVIKAILSWIVYPLIALLTYFFKRHATDIYDMKAEIAQLKITQAVIDSQTKDIREDIKDLMVLIREHEKSISEDLKSLRQDILDVSRR